MKATWPVCACEYQFVDEGLADLLERLKEMLDIDATIDDLDTTQEIPAEIGEKSVPTGRIDEVAFVHIYVCCIFTSVSYRTGCPVHKFIHENLKC